MKKLLRINLILTAVAVALVFTAQRLHSSMSFDDGICPPCIPPRCLSTRARGVIEQHPHPNDNRWYFVCDGGEAFCLRCGDGLTYNPMTECCDSVNPPDSTGNGGTRCPDPYDVVDHGLDYCKTKGEFVVDGNGNITITIYRFKVPFTVRAGTVVSADYIIYDCRMEAMGSCCPASRVGEIKLISIFQ